MRRMARRCQSAREPRPVRVAILSLLFNWPSTGGGNMHTAGLVEFLGRDGFDARHFYAQYEPWGIGRVTRDDLAASEPLAFAETEWNVASIRERFRAAVDSFAPDYVVISDTWNMKPHLADATRGYPTILLMQAQECLCPLNNLRLLGIGPVKAEQCPRNQLATPQVCHQCLAERGQHSGALHQVERALAGVGTPEYDGLMRQMFQEAEAVLVLNPITAALLEPFARRVSIVPWGIDPARFPWPADGEESEPQTGENTVCVVGSDVAPMGLEGKEAAGVQFPGFAPRAIRSRPSRASEKVAAIDSISVGSEDADAGESNRESSEPQPGRNHIARDVNPGLTIEQRMNPFNSTEPQPGRHHKARGVNPGSPDRRPRDAPDRDVVHGGRRG